MPTCKRELYNSAMVMVPNSNNQVGEINHLDERDTLAHTYSLVSTFAFTDPPEDDSSSMPC